MRDIQWRINAGAVLLIALAYFFDTSGMLSAFVPAAAVHELGHIAALRTCGVRVRRVSLSVFGMEIDYTGRLFGLREIISIAAGPLAGIVYAVAACSAGGEFWKMSGVISFLLSAFNLLPVLPLDGGRLVAALTEPVTAKKLSRVCSVILTAGGLAALLTLGALPMLLTGAWLLVYNFS